jgi:hypothetical protein
MDPDPGQAAVTPYDPRVLLNTHAFPWCSLCSVSDPDWIRIQFRSVDPEGPTKIEKKLRNFMFEVLDALF